MTKRNQGYTFRNITSQARIARLLELLRKPHTREELADLLELLRKPHTREELADLLDLSLRSTQAYLTHLMNEKPRRIHVHDWRGNSPGSPSAVYLVGDHKDKRKPRAMTGSERMRKRREDPEAALDHIMRCRLARIKPRRDPLVAALFGPA